jgi:rhodanese-related sulfurtransferase
MNCKRAVLITTLLAALGAAPFTFNTSSALAAELPTGLVAKDGWYTQIVDAAFVERYAVLPKPEGVMIIDSRPTTRKYDPGHIPTAINIPDTQFDKLTDQLPQDKNTLLIFYCEGVECSLSHSSAFKAEKLGYTNIKVYAEGYPDWIAKGHLGAVSVPFLKKRMDDGAPITVIDSRPKKRKYDLGHIPGAISLPDSEFNKRVDALPADKASELYFYCEGLACTLSSDSAAKAVKLGYTKVKVVPEGYPKWAKLYGPAPPAANR